MLTFGGVPIESVQMFCVVILGVITVSVLCVTLYYTIQTKKINEDTLRILKETGEDEDV